MLILNQDKMQIINFNNIRIIEINTPETWNQGYYSIDTYPECEDQQNWHIRLGKYDTEERAKEVLKEIIKVYKSQQYIVFNVENGEYKQLENKRVYEMPEK